MILTFVSLGKFIEEISKNNASRSLEDLISLVPLKVKILKNNIEEYIDINKVNIGDIIVCKKGDIIPLDGKIVKGAATIDQSNFTGESLPVTKNEKDSVISGTTILNGYLNIVCTTTSENSSFKTLIDSINKSSESKPPITKITDKIAKYFVPVIMCISIISFGIYLICTHDLELSLNFGISVLVVACPCALALATPIAIMVGTSSAAKNGILIKSGDILQKNGNIKCVAFDKTGTLTNGKPIVTDFINIKDDKNILSILYSMEIYSNHPLSNAITDYSFKNNIDYIELEDIEEIDGKGIVSKLNDDIYKFGNKKFVDYDVTEYEYLSKQGKTVLYLFKNDILYAVIAVKDQIKDGAKETIDCLNKKNIKTLLIQGIIQKPQM
jgi:heavy metal translocating P-type ATPase